MKLFLEPVKAKRVEKLKQGIMDINRMANTAAKRRTPQALPQSVEKRGWQKEKLAWLFKLLKLRHLN
jgi:hypothetical protein